MFENSRTHRRPAKPVFRRLRPPASPDRPSPINGWQIAATITNMVKVLARVFDDHTMMNAITGRLHGVASAGEAQNAEPQHKASLESS